MSYSVFLLSFLFLLGPVSKAAVGGDEMGNGGVTILCEVEGKKVYEVYDLYEGKKFHRLNMKFADGANYLEIVKNTISRLKTLNPTRTKLYQEYLAQFPLEANFIPNADFSPTPDIGSGGKPDGCSIVQAVIQFRKPNITGLRYFFNETVWNELDEKNKAALVLHELIYREGLQEENAFSSSVGVRYFNAVLQSELIEKITLRQYIVDVLGYSSFMDADAHGYQIRLHTGLTKGKPRALPVEFWNDNIVKKASLGNKISILVPNKRWFNFGCNIIAGREGSHSISFHESGVVKKVNLQCVNPMGIGLSIENEAAGGIFGQSYYYRLDGSLESIEFATGDIELPLAFHYYSPYFDFERTLSKKSADLVVDFDRVGLVSYLCYGKDDASSTNWYIENGEKKYINTFNDKPGFQSVEIHFKKDKVVKVEAEFCSAGQKD